MRSRNYSALFFLLLFPLASIGQTLGDYLEEMNTAESIDQSYNNHIDSLWNKVFKQAADSLERVAHVADLFAYADSSGNEITRDKAELHGYFILLGQDKYQKIVTRFEQRVNEYSRRAIVTTQEIYRKSYLRMTGTGLSDFRAHLTDLAKIITSDNFKEFYLSELDIQKGERSPDFEITDLAGNIHNLATLAGKVVVLDFWATWCGPCVKDLPKIKALYDKFRDNEDFVLISVSLDKDVEVVRKFAEQRNMAWAQTVDKRPLESTRNHDGEMTTKFKAKGVPKYFLLDKQGIIRYNSHLTEGDPVPEKLIDRYLVGH